MLATIRRLSAAWPKGLKRNFYGNHDCNCIDVLVASIVITTLILDKYVFACVLK